MPAAGKVPGVKAGPLEDPTLESLTSEATPPGETPSPGSPPPVKPAVEVHEGPPPGGGQSQEDLDREAAEVEARLKDRLQNLTQEDVVDLLELAFSLVAIRRGEHWQMKPEESGRIALWVHRAVERHGVAWVGKWLPDIMAAGLLTWAIKKRLDVDEKLAPKPETKPPEA